MSALRDRDVLGGRAVQNMMRPTLRELAYRALVAPGRPPLLAKLSRAGLLHEAVVVGARRHAEGGDVFALATDFMGVRAELRKRRRRPARAPSGAGLVKDRQVEALLDDVLVALVRGYEGSPELATSPASTGPTPRPNRAPPPIAMVLRRGSDQ